MKDCLLRYVAGGWSGSVPKACRNTQLHLPENVAPWLWGWPSRFTERMRAVDTRVVLTAKGDGFSAGFDRPGDLERVPDGFDGMLWTNRAEVMIPALDD